MGGKDADLQEKRGAPKWGEPVQGERLCPLEPLESLSSFANESTKWPSLAGSSSGSLFCLLACFEGLNANSLRTPAIAFLSVVIQERYEQIIKHMILEELPISATFLTPKKQKQAESHREAVPSG